MLTYEYLCETCGLKFERRQAITEIPLTECPKCRGTIRRLFSGGAGLILKGSGQSRAGQRASGCSLEQEGRTCCGREERCGEPQCAGEK
jgi:putative FmdB family regulatory protein